jgi:hypothetical protein
MMFGETRESQSGGLIERTAQSKDGTRKEAAQGRIQGIFLLS